MPGTRQHLKKPLWAAILSLLALLGFAAYTNPTDRVGYALIFFAITLMFLISLGHLLATLRWGEVSPRGRARIFSTSALIVVALMLRSSGSLNPLEVLVLIFIGVGLWFYSGRRAF